MSVNCTQNTGNILYEGLSECPHINNQESRVRTEKIVTPPINNMNEEDSPKHIKYKDSYVANDLYYGLGIENETYLLSDKSLIKTADWLINNHKRERYSVDYWSNFSREEIDLALHHLDKNKKFKLPVLINSHTFTKCDIKNNHKTRYTSVGEANPNFDGSTIHDVMMEKSEYFRNNFDKQFMYDGDTFEFTTLDYYKTTVDKCVKQLLEYKKRFLNEINKVFTENNILSEHYNNRLNYATNYGFANFIANQKNLAICNNSTYHINITLPTLLDSNKKIKDMKKFQEEHSNAIRAIQWIEPLFIACYGSPDIFSVGNSNFAKGSLRLALSRYISVGTYDTKKMPSKKLLNNFEYDPTLLESGRNVPITSTTVFERQINEYASTRKHWYKRYHETSGYIPQKMIGFDINYQKHYNHGIEIRFFDYFSEEYLVDVINMILLVCQKSLVKKIRDPRNYVAYDDQMIECIKNGSDAKISVDYVRSLGAALGCRTLYKIYRSNESIGGDTQESTKGNPPEVMSIVEMFQHLINKLYTDLHDSSFLKQISPNMKKPIVINYNKIMFDMNKTFLITGEYKSNNIVSGSKKKLKQDDKMCHIQ